MALAIKVACILWIMLLVYIYWHSLINETSEK